MQLSLIAGAPINKGDLISIYPGTPAGRAFVASQLNFESATVIGVAQNGAATNNIVVIRTDGPSGEIYNGIVPGKNYFLGTDGKLKTYDEFKSQVQGSGKANAFVTQIGTGLTLTQITVDIEQPVYAVTTGL